MTDTVTIARCNPHAAINQKRGNDNYSLTNRKLYLIQSIENDPYVGDFVWICNDAGRTVRVLKARFTDFQTMTLAEFQKVTRTR